MKKVQCPEGHFYDADMFSACPMCENMENISKNMSSKKAKFGKKSKEEVEKPVVPNPAPKKANRKKNSPAQGNVVTVAVFPSGNNDVEREENPGNNGILDENGHLILKVERKQPKKQISEDEYITAAEIAEKNKAEEPEPEAEPELEAEENAVIIIEESSNEITDNPESKESVSEEPAPEKVEAEEPAPEETVTEEPAAEEAEAEEPVREESRFTAPAITPVIPSEYKSPEGGPKTVGFYHFDVEPVVGWLVCVTGDIKGKSFKLKSGQNIIGDSGIMDVYLPSKEKRKGDALAVLIFEPIKKEFMLRVTGAVDCSVNGKKTETYVALKNYDKIKIGDYMLIFKALCSEKFDWKDYE